jgi:hypothetical protein
MIFSLIQRQELDSRVAVADYVIDARRCRREHAFADAYEQDECADAGQIACDQCHAS